MGHHLVFFWITAVDYVHIVWATTAMFSGTFTESQRTQPIFLDTYSLLVKYLTWAYYIMSPWYVECSAKFYGHEMGWFTTALMIQKNHWFHPAWYDDPHWHSFIKGVAITNQTYSRQGQTSGCLKESKWRRENTGPSYELNQQRVWDLKWDTLWWIGDGVMSAQFLKKYLSFY